MTIERPTRSASRGTGPASGGRAAASGWRIGRPATAATTASTMSGSSARRPVPDCPEASGPVPGAMTVYPNASRSRPTFATVAGCVHMSPSIAGATTTGALLARTVGRDDVAREPVRHRAEPVGGRGRDDDRVGGVGDDDVADPAVRQEVEQVRLDRMPRQRRERQRADEPRRARRQEDDDVGALGGQESQQLDRLVGGDRAGDAQGDEPAFEAVRGRVAHVSGSSSGWPPATSAWRIARPLSVSSGSIASTPSSAPVQGSDREPAGEHDVDVRRPRRRPRRRARGGSARAGPRRAPGSRGRRRSGSPRSYPARSPDPGPAAPRAGASRSARRARRGRARCPGRWRHRRTPRRARRSRTSSRCRGRRRPRACRTAARRRGALTSRSAPTSPGRSVRIGIGTVPAPAMSSGRSRRAATASSASVTAGTTDAQAIAETSANAASSRRSRSSRRTSSSSGVVPRGVAARRTAISDPFRNEPTVTFELPMSIASSTARSYATSNPSSVEREPPRASESKPPDGLRARYHPGVPSHPECPRRRSQCPASRRRSSS